MDARSLASERGIPMAVACHAACARRAGLIHILSTLEDYRKVPSLVLSGIPGG